MRCLSAKAARAGSRSRGWASVTSASNLIPSPQSPLVFNLPARHVEGKHFDSAAELQEKFYAAAPVQLPVTITR